METQDIFSGLLKMPVVTEVVPDKAERFSQVVPAQQATRDEAASVQS